MKSEFCTNSWSETGSERSFDEPCIHPYVIRCAPPAFLAGKRVLVPLRGELSDLIWFWAYAEHVTGVEPSVTVVEQFFAEHSIAFKRVGSRYEAEGLTILCGDLLELDRASLGRVDLVYDRASFGHPLETRARHREKLHELLHEGATILLNTLEHDPILDGPSFSVGPADIYRYHHDRYKIERVETPMSDDHGRLRDLNDLIERLFIRTRHDP